MEYALYTALSWLILLVTGLPLCLRILPLNLRRHGLLFAPVVGFSVVTFVSYYLFRLGIGGTGTYAWPLFFVSITGLSLQLGFSARARSDLRAALNVESFSVLVLLALGLVMINAPFYAASGGRALAGSMSNLDIAELAVVSRFLQEFPPHASIGFLGQSSHLVTTCRDIWFGPSIIVAWIGSLIHAAPFQLQMIVMSVIAIQAVGFIYVLARAALNFGAPSAALIAVIYLLSPVPLFTVWQSFGGQMIATALMLALFTVQISSFKNREIDAADSRRNIPISVLLLSGIILSYHFMVPISGLVLGGFMFGALVFSSDRKYVFKTAGYLVLAYGLCGILNPYRVVAFIGSIAMLTGSNGWFIPWLGPDILAGNNAGLAFLTATPLTHRSVALALIGLAFLPVIWRMVRENTNAILRSFCTGMVLPTFALGLAFAYMDIKDGQLGGYRSFKITACFSGLTILAAAAGFQGVSWRTHRLRFALGLATAAVTLLLSARSAKELAVFTREHAVLPVREIQALQEVETMPSVNGINVMDADNFSLLWTNYFTLRVRQVYQRFPYTGRPVGFLKEPFTLTKDMKVARAAGYTDDIFSVEGREIKKVYPLGPWYKLCEATESQDISVTPGDGWWPSEATHRWSGSKGSLSSVYVDAKTSGVRVFVEATFNELRPNNHLTARVNGRAIGLEHSLTRLRTDPFVLQPGRNVIEFETSLSPSQPTSWDPRTLNIAWVSVAVRLD